MQSAQDGAADYATNRLDSAWNRRVLVQGQVRTRLIAILQVRQQHVTEVSFAKHNDMIDALPSFNGVWGNGISLRL